MAAKKSTTTQSAEPIDTALASGVEAMKEGFEKAVKGYDQIVAFGKDNAEAVLKSARPLLTVAPHAVAAEPVANVLETEVRGFAPELSDQDVALRVVEHVPAPGGGVSLKEAKVVVSGGRGVGSKEGFAIIEELAGLLGAAVGCSRAVTSAGWRPHTDQVGQTGTKIAPDVYIACGISGATQHMAGCKAAKKILAINSDADASIMANADYAVIGDLKEILPAISDELRKRR